MLLGFTSSQTGPGMMHLLTLAGGGWQKHAFPIPTARVTFADFACPAVNECEALLNGTPYQWDMHHTWTPQTLAPTGLANSFVGAVACADTSDCVAEGGGTIGSKGVPFIERWDGTAWSFVALTQPPHGGELFDIACATRTMCMAVGNEAHPNAQDVGFSSSIAYRHKGSTWNLSHAPDTKNAIFGQLTGVACPTVHTCLATSTFTNDGDAGQAQADVWHDGHWRLTPLPGIPAAAINDGTSGIGAPACMAVSACIAVGSWDYFTTADHTGPVVEVWNGRTWRSRRGRLPVPAGGVAGSGVFASVACGSPTTCILAGNYTTTTGAVNLYVAERDQPTGGG